MKRNILKIVDRIDVSKHIANHLVGEKHTHYHRKIFGIIIMMIGVFFAKLMAIPESNIIHFSGDLIGSGIHGIGLIPFASSVEKQSF